MNRNIQWSSKRFVLALFIFSSLVVNAQIKLTPYVMGGHSFSFSKPNNFLFSFKSRGLELGLRCQYPIINKFSVIGDVSVSLRHYDVKVGKFGTAVDAVIMDLFRLGKYRALTNVYSVRFGPAYDLGNYNVGIMGLGQFFGRTYYKGEPVVNRWDDLGIRKKRLDAQVGFSLTGSRDIGALQAISRLDVLVFDGLNFILKPSFNLGVGYSFGSKKD
jgi:hypothetical protein